MATAALALLMMEQGANLVDFVAMLNSGDNQIFTAANPVFSGEEGREPELRPNGIVTGRNLVGVPASGANDVVDVAAFTAYSKGALKTVAAGVDTSITRPATNVSRINSITMDSTGAIAVVAGTSGSDGTFSEGRGVAGGPPFIPVDSVELAQVRIASSTAAPITANEIYQVIGQHAERYDFPVFDIDNTGQGDAAEVAAQTSAHVKFASALPLAHTADVPKRVYIKYHDPIFGEVSDSVDFKAVETSHSTSSEQVYGRSVGSNSESLGQGGFSALVSDGVKDVLVQEKNKTKTFKFFPNKNKTPYVLTQGKLGIAREWPAATQIKVTATISAERASADFSS